MVAATLNSGGNSGGFRTEPGEHLVFGGNNTQGPIDTATACNAHRSRYDFESLPFVAHALKGKGNDSHDESHDTYVTHSLRAEGFDANEDGTGRGTPLVTAIAQNQRGELRQSDIMPQLTCGGGKPGEGYPAIAFSSKDHGADAGELAPTLRAGPHDKSHANGGVMPAIAFESRYARNGRGAPSNVVPPLKAQSGQTGKGDAAPLVTVTLGANSGRNQIEQTYIPALRVRRLTPRECERLQGFPDDYTKIPWRNKAAADCPDGPRYRALGNSMAVPVVKWIGERIDMVEALSA